MHIKEVMLAARSSTLAPVEEGSQGPSEMTINLLIALFALVFMGLLLFAVLVLLRRMKRRQAMHNGEMLPSYHEVKRTGNHRRLTIQTSTDGRHSVLVFSNQGPNGQPMLANPQSPPHSPDNVPEIHITFPDEQDEQGRPRSGRVLVVRVGEAGAVGMEPLHDEQLPAYEKESSSQFYSIDIEKIGGLKEKDREDFR